MNEIQLEIPEPNKTKTLIYVNADDCVISEFNTRKTRYEKDVKKLAQRIERNGFEVTRALWGYQGEGCYQIFAGGTRLEAVKRTSEKNNVPLLLYEGYSDREIARLEAQDNKNDEYHEEVPIVDIWAEYARLRDEEGWTQKGIAEVKNVTQAMVSYRLRLNRKLPGTIKDFITQGELAETHCREILKLSLELYFAEWLTDEQLWINLANMAVKKTLSVSKLKTHIDYWEKRIEIAEENYQNLEEQVKIGDEILEPRKLYVEELARMEASTQKECQVAYSEVQALVEKLQKEHEQQLKEEANDAARKAREAREEKERIRLQQRYEPEIHMRPFNVNELEENSVKMVITSPEYYSPEVWDHADFEELLKSQIDLFDSMKPKLREDAILCVNMNDLRNEKGVLYPYTQKFTCRMIEKGFNLRDEIIWNKVAKPPANSEEHLTDYKEFVFVFTLEIDTEVNIEAINDETVEDRGNMWNISPDKREGDLDIYPFPKKLVRYCLLYGSEEDDLVVDPYLGTGTTCVVCKKMRRRSVGFEKNKDLTEEIKERIDRVAVDSKNRR